MSEPLSTHAVLAATVSAVAVTVPQWSALGVPSSVFFACAAGALWSATWFEHQKKVAKPLAVIVNGAAGVVLSTGLAEWLGLSAATHAVAGFIASAWPVMIAESVRDSIIGALQRVIGKKEGNS